MRKRCLLETAFPRCDGVEDCEKKALWSRKRANGRYGVCDIAQNISAYPRRLRRVRAPAPECEGGQRQPQIQAGFKAAWSPVENSYIGNDEESGNARQD